MLKKVVIGGVFTLGVLIFGFVMLLRSCLSKYDERGVVSTPLIIEDKGKTVVFTLVKFEKATSYSRNGGFIRKSVSTSYHIQTNDGITGAKLRSQKIKKHSRVKTFPVEVLGLADKKAWIFIGELMAFDPFTLEKTADAAMIEIKNPSLKGKLTNERRYYEYDHQYGIRITAKDGAQYLLNTSTLIATPYLDEIEKDPGKARQKQLEKQLASYRVMSDSNYTRFRRANKLYSDRKISAAVYKDSSDRFMAERTIISKMEDSVRQLSREVDEEMDALREAQRIEETLQRNVSFSQLRVNTDSFHNKWYGLMTAEEMEKLSEQFDYRRVYGEIERNNLYAASIAVKDPSKKYSKWIIGAEKEKLSGAIFLQGGFLLDISTGKPIHLSNPDAFLVVYKEQLGTDAKTLLSRIDIAGKQAWSINTELKEFVYWTIHNGKLYLFGTDNKELSSGEINLLQVIDLANGNRVAHDYFKDKGRTMN